MLPPPSHKTNPPASTSAPVASYFRGVVYSRKEVIVQKKYKSIENIERDFLTIEQTAEYIGKSYHHTHRLITKGNRFNKIPFTLLFGRKIVKKKDLEKFVIDKSRRLEDKNRLKDM